YMEYIARTKKIEGNKALIEVRAFKVIEVPKDPPFPSSIDVLPEPVLSTVGQFVYETL
ncbi:MAG TPA: acyl-CoA hydrolase, partial [Terrisporobacter glycolicus]|nr:acyl-CoA hydrolase [Terrisporobacter hibernicus]